MGQNKTLTARVAANVRAELGRANVSQSRLAASIGISQSALSKRLHGRVPFGVDELEQIANYLVVPLSTLMDDTRASA